MSVSTFMGLETALRGLLAQQRQLDVTAHNVANANTPGFTRQTVALQASDPFNTTNGQLGTGVTIGDYTRIRDQFLDVQLRAQTTLQSKYEAQQDVLQQVELAVDEPSDTGIQTLLSKFFDSWQDVENSPDNPATRQALVQNGNALASGIASLRNQLGLIDSQTTDNIGQVVDDVNQTLKDVADLNTQIGTAVASGQQPSSDLLDRRDVLLDKLGTLVNLKVTQDVVAGKPTGTVTLSIDDATATPPSAPLLDGGSSIHALDAAALPPSLTAGKIGGLVAAQAQVVAFEGQVNAFAKGLIDGVNGALGVGNEFFAGTDAASIAVLGTVVADPSTLEVSSTAGGDADLARAVTQLRSGSVTSSYTIFVTDVGSQSQTAQRSAANAQVLADALKNRRESVSGVSLDEEMTNLIRYQRAYQASARALTAMDDLVSTLIDRTGKVGM